jgi:hypothetical protein
MVFNSTLSSKLEEREKENAQSVDCLRLVGERKDGRPSWISGGGSRGGGEFDQLYMEHHLRDDQAENVSFSLVTMELKLMAVTSMFLW